MNDSTPSIERFGLANFPDLTEAAWDEVLERLTLYAHRRCLRLIWRGVPGSRGGKVPGGLEPADIAAQAIVDVIEGRRIWNRDDMPEFMMFLRGVVDSKLSHLARSLENRMLRSHYQATRGASERRGVTGGAVPPGQASVEMEELVRLQTAISRVIEGDPLAAKVVECLMDDVTKPAAIATRVGVEVRQIYNAQKRLRHKIETVLMTHQGAEQ